MTVKDAIGFMKDPGQILASQTLHSSIEKPMGCAGRSAAARPQSKLRCSGGERAGMIVADPQKQTLCGGKEFELSVSLGMRLAERQL